MAFLDDQNQLQQTQGSQGAQVNAPAPAPQTVSGSGSGDVGSGVSTAGVGAGGTGGWTNIQAYINANKDSNSGANALNNTVGKQFDQEQNNMQGSASNAKNQADSQVSGNKIGQDQASQIIGGYDPSADNTAVKGQFNNALHGQYSGPTNWTYSQSAPTTNYGQALSNDQGFQGLMGQLYNNAAGGQINAGELALQQQLDVNNPQMSQSRNDLNAKYKALQDMGGQTMNDTNQAIQNDMTQYGQNESDLQNNLTSQSGAIKGGLDAYYGGSLGGRIGPSFNPANQISQYNAINALLGNGSSYAQPVGPPATPPANPFIPKTAQPQAPPYVPGADDNGIFK